jgi:integrase
MRASVVARRATRQAAVSNVSRCLRFTPTYGSWLNLVERGFAELTNKQLRRGVHRSVAQLKAAIRQFIDAHHADPKPFVWTKTADQILESIARFAQRTLDFQAAPLIARTTRTGHSRAYGRKPATINRFLSQLRHMIGWAIGRSLLERSPFGRYGIKVRTRAETRRERRLSPAEEEQLLKACDTLQAQPRHEHLGAVMRYRIIGALDTCCRQGEMLRIQNNDVDWQRHWISIRAEHAKDGESRKIPFEEDGRLAKILQKRRFLGPDAYLFGDVDGAFVKNFRTAWETVLLVHTRSQANAQHSEGVSRQWR